MSDKPADIRLAAAQARATVARTRLSATIGALQDRTKPRSLVHEVSETVKTRGADALTAAAETAKREPVRSGVAMAAVALFLARRPIIRLIRNATSSKAKS